VATEPSAGASATGAPASGGANGAGAQAAFTRSVISSQADSPGPIVTDSSGNGYVAWLSSAHNANGDPTYFCKIPRGGKCTHPQLLPIPKVDKWSDYGLLQPFPVIGGKAGVVSIVAPSYDYSDVVVWTSTNSGTSFSEPAVIGNCSYDGTGVGDVLRSPDADKPYYPDYFVIASSNPGLFYTFTGIGAIGAPDPPKGFKQNTSHVPGAVDSTTTGYGQTVNPGPQQETQTVQAFGTDATKPQLDFIWSPVPGVSGSPGSLMHGPIFVTDGMNPRLAGGPKGLFLLSEDYVGDPTTAKKLVLDVRKWDPSTERFGAPSIVATLRNDVNASNSGGFAEDSKSGALTVAWPMEPSSGGYVMDVWTSTAHTSPNGVPEFGAAVKAGPVAGGYVGPPRIAMHNGAGFLTWQDSGGLELADIS
jgi:hypothetical protein